MDPLYSPAMAVTVRVQYKQYESEKMWTVRLKLQLPAWMTIAQSRPDLASDWV